MCPRPSLKSYLCIMWFPCDLRFRPETRPCIIALFAGPQAFVFSFSILDIFLPYPFFCLLMRRGLVAFAPLNPLRSLRCHSVLCSLVDLYNCQITSSFPVVFLRQTPYIFPTEPLGTWRLFSLLLDSNGRFFLSFFHQYGTSYPRMAR